MEPAPSAGGENRLATETLALIIYAAWDAEEFRTARLDRMGGTSPNRIEKQSRRLHQFRFKRARIFFKASAVHTRSHEQISQRRFRPRKRKSRSGSACASQMVNGSANDKRK